MSIADLFDWRVTLAHKGIAKNMPLTTVGFLNVPPESYFIFLASAYNGVRLILLLIVSFAQSPSWVYQGRRRNIHPDTRFWPDVDHLAPPTNGQKYTQMYTYFL